MTKISLHIILFFMEIKNAAHYFSCYKKLEKNYIDFLQNALISYDLSPNEIVVLSSLENINTASEIALSSDVSKALVSRSVKMLKAKGHITTNISPVDKREQTLELTESGKEISLLIDEANHRFFATAFANFEENESKLLKALLNMMMRNLNIDF